VGTAFAPHAPYSVGDAPLARVRRLADELELPVHMHVHETRDEVDQGIARDGRRPLARLDALGLVSPGLVAVHMTQLEDDEIALCADRGVQLVHCPESNLKLASGFCPVERLLAAGINVALGTDGAASNNDLDMLGELRTAALLAKGVAQDPSAVPAATALRMATLNGAKALGLGEAIGSLEPGKEADMVAVDLSFPETQPVHHPISQLVYAAGRRQVSHVWVAGRPVLLEGRLTTVDLDKIRADAEQWRERIAGG
jgi:5-methylthioadenosine/S-adenosylhomocysteine deaminase